MECIRTDGVDISRFMLGTVQLGLNYGMANTTGKPSEEKAREILNAAYESGVTVLDTAAAYGTSEEVVGNYLKAGNSEAALALADQYASRMTPAQKKRFVQLFEKHGAAWGV